VSKRKRKRKPSRRQRQAGIDRPAKRPADPAAVTPEPATDPEVPETVAETPTPGTPDPAPTVTAVFRPSTKSEAVVSLEQEYIGHDLRRLGVLIAALATALTGVAVLQAQTNLIGELGAWLFTWWN
jgi:hypothetical protein